MSTNRHPIEQEELMAYLDGELLPGQATEALSHLEICPECQTLGADFRDVSHALMAWEVESPEVGIPSEISAALGERLQRRKAAKVSSPRLENRVMTSRWVWAGALAIVCVAVGLKLTLTSRNRNEDRSTAYPSMASIEQYLMPDRNSEIAMARSAAPEAISDDAKILVLGWRGYETAIEQERFCLYGGTIMDVPIQLRRVLEPQGACAGLFQSGSRAIHSASHDQADGDGISWVVESSDDRQHQGRIRQ